MKRENLYCRAVGLRGLPELITELGGSAAAFFADADLDLSFIRNGDNFYDWSKICGLLEAAARDMNEPALGLKWARRLSMDMLNSGPSLLMGQIASEMRGAFDMAIAYQRLHTNGVQYGYREFSATNTLVGTIDIHSASPPCRQFTEHILAFLMIAERHHINKANISAVTFQHRAPADLSLHNEIFQCSVSFDAPQNTIVFNADYLNIKTRGLFKGFQPILKMYLNRRIAKSPRYGVNTSQMVARILPTILGMNISRATQVARIMEVSPKKLQRLLKDEGETYSGILETARQNVAERLLFESDISISHLAALLDYASTEAFNAACKRWFGMSPRAYRKQLRAV